MVWQRCPSSKDMEAIVLLYMSGAANSGTIGEVLNDTNCLSNERRTGRDSDTVLCYCFLLLVVRLVPFLVE
eukprot:756482-Hanusia_phi.AAC.2